MANSAQAKKRIRQTNHRTVINRRRHTRIRTFVKRVELAIAAGDKQAANDALRAAEPELMRGAKVGVLHKNTASRKVSRLSSRIAKM